MGEGGLTHLDPQGRVRMVDVSGKPAAGRRAAAEATVSVSAETLDLIFEGGLPKGDAVGTARLAGIMAAKKTAELIPLCHPLSISYAAVDVSRSESGVSITASVRTTDRTGVEMEALTAVSIAALALYDMIKGVERGARIENVRLLAKSGGRSGDWSAETG